MKRLFACGLLTAAFLAFAAFNLDNTLVPKDEILSGGVPKDGIPALLEPRFVAAGEAHFLNPDDQVIGVRLRNQVKAYPIKILNWHEVVNDAIGGIPVVVTF